MRTGNAATHQLKIMVRVPEFDPAAVGGRRGTAQYLRQCVHKVLDEYYNLPIVAPAAPNAWRFRSVPGSIAFPLLGSKRQLYSCERAAENVVAAIQGEHSREG